MIDSHCHLDLDAFKDDLPEVVKRFKNIGGQRCLIPGLTLEQFVTIKNLQLDYPLFDICLGLHPYFLKALPTQQQTQQLQQLNDLGDQFKSDIVAIGETGLDGVIELDMSYQIDMLCAQIELAIRLKKPLILHHRQSHNLLIKLLKQYDFSYGGVIHAFSGSEQIALTYINLGFLLGVGGTITYPRAKKTRQTISRIPLEHIVLETDSPDMPINGFQGQRNEPSRLTYVVETLGELKQQTQQDIIRICDDNYGKLFGSSA